MTDTTYTAAIGADNIADLCDTAGAIGVAGLLDHVLSADDSPSPDVIVFDNQVARALRDLPEDSDGHYDDEAIWIGGLAYPVSIERP